MALPNIKDKNLGHFQIAGMKTDVMIQLMGVPKNGKEEYC